jgi:TRAP transporter 4TM/12TM fusion protein
MLKSSLRPVSYALQAILVAMVVGWVLDVPARLNIALYTEQFLIACVGCALALVFLTFDRHGGKHGGGKEKVEITAAPGASVERLATAIPEPVTPIEPGETAAALAHPRADARIPYYDLIAGAIGFLACLYVAVDYPVLVNELVYRPWDGIAVATAIVLLILEATRRTAGTALTVVILVLCVYALIGWMLPGTFAARPVALSRLMVYLGIDSNALLGAPLQVAAIVIVPFVLMGQILTRAGGGDFFTDLSMALMGRYRGGSAKIAVVGSAFFGMVSGSAVANVASVGTITIPLMKRSGFPPTTAGAIEAVGSTGGQLMPPVMGAAAFLMAEYLQVSYATVMAAATLPAILYYAALFIQVDLEAARRGILGAPAARLPQVAEVIRAGWFFPIPFVVLVLGLVSWNWQAEYAALAAAGVLLILAMTIGYKGKRLGPAAALDAIVSTGTAVLDIIIVTAAAGLVIGVLNLTGVAFGLTMQLLAVSGESLTVLLLVTAAVAVVLGMGMPTVGVYVILATLAAPALVKAGISPMQAHMFVMYFGMLSMVTPPVALAAFAAANIAGASFWTTGWTAARIGWCAYLVPFLFALSPSLLATGGDAVDITLSFVTALIGIYLGSAAVVGYLRRPLGFVARVLYGVFGVMLLIPVDMFAAAGIVNVVGLIGAVTLGAVEWLRGKKEAVGV